LIKSKYFSAKKKLKKSKKFLLSDNTIKRRIDDMGIDVENQILTQMKEGKAFALQLDESTDISKKAQLLVYVRYVNCFFVKNCLVLQQERRFSNHLTTS
jgi:hypothetical protein